MIRLQKNQILTAFVLETNMMGHGVVKMDGAVIFVQNAVAGDEAEIKIIKCAKSYYIARIERLLTPSPNRVEPLCPHSGPCGGCSFQHITYEHELELKRNYVLQCLRKEGLADITVLPVLSTKKVSSYRNKAMYPVAFDPKTNKVFCGFYSQKSHRVCAAPNCDIQHPLFSKITDAICGFFTEKQIAPYNEEEHSGLVRHIYLRVGEGSGQIMACLVLREDAFPCEKEFVDFLTKEFPQIKSICFNVQSDVTNVVMGKRTRLVYGNEKIEDIFLEKHLLISPASFYQVNHDAAELLYQTAFAMASVESFDQVIDLYCGIGSIALTVPGKKKIKGIEIVPEAVRDAKENALLCGADHAEFICGDAAQLFQSVKESKNENSLVIVDPPRKGLAKQLILDFAAEGIDHILYISCGPDTLARDLAVFSKLGYVFDSVQPVDLFPRTSHVESVAVLHRNKEASQ